MPWNCFLLGLELRPGTLLKKTSPVNFAKCLRITFLQKSSSRLFLMIVDLKNYFGEVKSNCREVFCKESVLQTFTKFTGKQLCWSLFLNRVAGLRHFKAYNFIKKETPTQLLSCEFYKSCFTEHVRGLFVGVYLRLCQASRIGNF